MVWHPPLQVPSIAVLAGGQSAEREVSLESGRCAAEALSQAGYSPKLIDPAKVVLADVPWSRFSAAFIALHGGAGEDGRIQRRLELLRVPYTGSSPEACRLSMSKAASKQCWLAAGLPTKPYTLIDTRNGFLAALQHLTPLGFPLVLKPDSGGSSLGVVIARSPDDVSQAMSQAGQYDRFLLAEPVITGREFTVTVLDQTALPVIEIQAARPIFDYQAKYRDTTTRLLLDPPLPRGMAQRLQVLAIEAAHALGTRGLVRVDFMLDKAQHPWLLELNSVPGLTSTSLAPRSAAHAGLPMPQLCDHMVRCAMVRSAVAEEILS